MENNTIPRNTTGKEEMNQINVKEKCWEENTWNKRKRHNNLLKKKLTNMKENY